MIATRRAEQSAYTHMIPMMSSNLTSSSWSEHNNGVEPLSVCTGKRWRKMKGDNRAARALLASSRRVELYVVWWSDGEPTSTHFQDDDDVWAFFFSFAFCLFTTCPRRSRTERKPVFALKHTQQCCFFFFRWAFDSPLSLSELCVFTRRNFTFSSRELRREKYFLPVKLQLSNT